MKQERPNGESKSVIPNCGSFPVSSDILAAESADVTIDQNDERVRTAAASLHYAVNDLRSLARVDKENAEEYQNIAFALLLVAESLEGRAATQNEA